MVLLPISHLSHVAGAVEALRKTNWLEFNNPSRTTVAECTTIYAMCLARYYSYISRSGLYAETIAYPIHVGQIVYCYVHVGTYTNYVHPFNHRLELEHTTTDERLTDALLRQSMPQYHGDMVASSHVSHVT
jgi:hypothetical protein